MSNQAKRKSKNQSTTNLKHQPQTPTPQTHGQARRTNLTTVNRKSTTNNRQSTTDNQQQTTNN